ncbi:hypothetical protein ACJRO7_022542 [Eucalyptus globulus]|uniref:DUF4283 domain-containing protein n=1 Tax=Eucalyptus globulus TaxID=34317 RepID=A0ABD3K033_EUCGL
MVGVSSRLNAVGCENVSSGVSTRKEKRISFSRDSVARPLPAPRDQEPNPVQISSKKATGNSSSIPSGSKPQTQVRSWAAVTRSATKGYGLSFVPPATIENSKILQMPDELLEASHLKWEECLVGYYIGKRLPFQLTEDALKHAWGHHLIEVIAADLGFYFFHIPDGEFRKRVLDGGLITVAKIPLILQQWHPMLELKKIAHNTVPIWIRLRNVPVALWSAAGISFLASGIGKPLFVDNRTEQMAMVAFAHVCVEIDASNSLPEVVEFMMKGELRTVTVQYEWILALCPSCSTFGHKCPVPTEAGPSKVGLALPRSHGPPQNEWREVRSRRNKNIPDVQVLNSTRIAPIPPPPNLVGTSKDYLCRRSFWPLILNR